MQFFIPFLVLQNQLLLPDIPGSGTITFPVLQENANSIITMDLSIPSHGIASAEESYAPAAEIGSGSLFTVIGAAESFTANPDETQFYTILLELRNQLSELKRSKVLEQLQFLVNLVSRSFFTSMVLVESLSVELLENPLHQLQKLDLVRLLYLEQRANPSPRATTQVLVLLYFLVQQSRNKPTITLELVQQQFLVLLESNSLSTMLVLDLFAVGGAAESKTTNKPESTILFAVSGAATESFGKGIRRFWN